MLKNMVALLLLLFSVSSHAYLISSNLIIENNTPLEMDINISQPFGQETIVKKLPAHQATDIYLENGDRSGWLYQASTAFFSIKDSGNQTEYVNGRVAYYIGPTLWHKYSFLDSVHAGHGITVDKTYSCSASGPGATFENKIILNGSHSGPAPTNPRRNFIRCEGLKNTTLENDIRGQLYKILCSDNTESSFLKQQGECELVQYRDTSWYSNGCYWVKTGSYSSSDMFLSPNINSTQVKTELDNILGSSYCRDFVASLP